MCLLNKMVSLLEIIRFPVLWQKKQQCDAMLYLLVTILTSLFRVTTDETARNDRRKKKNYRFACNANVVHVGRVISSCVLQTIKYFSIYIFESDNVIYVIREFVRDKWKVFEFIYHSFGGGCYVESNIGCYMGMGIEKSKILKCFYDNVLSINASHIATYARHFITIDMRVTAITDRYCNCESLSFI